ncbi:hypothetical protein VTO58DRAFT_110929 [Aureobasidium pullulans]
MTGLQHFFKWQYPNFMFIYREAFLEDYFGTSAARRYWSPALLLSVCALGLLMSDQENHKAESSKCFNAAESIALVTGFADPSVVAVQTFLCLAFYSIGNGNLSKGWAFSDLDRWKQNLPHDMRGRDCASFETVPVPGYTTLQ